MEQKILGRVVGERIYDGTGITGTSTTATVFSDSGVEKALPGDKYINTDTGNVYKCVVGGAASSATWVWIMCIKSNQWNLIDSLTSDSAADALTARMGKKLKGMIDDINFGSTQINCDNEESATSIEVTIENADTVLTITDEDGNTGTYSYTASGLSDTTTLTFSMTDCGFSGAIVVKKVESSEAVISELSLLLGTDVVYEAVLGIWENINNAADNVSVSSTITDGETNYKTGIISKLINGVRKTLYPITHAMAVWYEVGVSTIKEKFDSLDEDIETLTGHLTDGTVTKVGTETVGSIYKLIYLKNGVPTESNGNVGDGTYLLLMQSGELKLSTHTIGNSKSPVYVKNGKVIEIDGQEGNTYTPVYLSANGFKALSATRGSVATPVYLNGGNITALTATRGSASQPVYLSGGEIKALTDTKGSTYIPVYLNNGVITPLSASVGDAYSPVYLSGGAIVKAGFKVQFGHTSVTLTRDSANMVSGERTVYFDNRFSSFPMVVATVIDTYSDGVFAPAIESVSTSSFRVSVSGYMSRASTTVVGLNYIAISAS